MISTVPAPAVAPNWEGNQCRYSSYLCIFDMRSPWVDRLSMFLWGLWSTEPTEIEDPLIHWTRFRGVPGIHRKLVPLDGLLAQFGAQPHPYPIAGIGNLPTPPSRGVASPIRSAWLCQQIHRPKIIALRGSAVRHLRRQDADDEPLKPKLYFSGTFIVYAEYTIS